MVEFIEDLARYLRAVLLEGIQPVFTFFDILGIALFFHPQLVEYLMRNELNTRISRRKEHER
jgi:hypothetical protein